MSRKFKHEGGGLTESKSNKLWLILGIIVIILGITGITYVLWPKKQASLNSEKFPNSTEILKSFQDQLTKQKDLVKDLDQTNQVTEKKLNDKNYTSQFPSVKLTKLNEELAKKKQKVEKLVFKLGEIEKLLSDLRQKSVELTQKIIQQLEQKISEVNVELSLPKQEGILSKNSNNPSPTNDSVTRSKDQGYSSLLDEKSDNSASSTNSPTKENQSNIQQFQTLRNQAKNLIRETEKIIANYTKRINDFKTANEKAKKEAQELGQEFDMEQGEFGEIFKKIEHHLEIAKRNKTTLEGYVSEKDYQTFLSASPETQQSNIDLVQDAIKHTVKSTQENLSDCLNWVQEMLQVVEDMLKGLKEGGLANEQEITQQEKELQKNKTILANLQAKLSELEKQTISEQIKTLAEAWTAIEKMEAENNENN